jgi:predicted aspartyl protease
MTTTIRRAAAAFFLAVGLLAASGAGAACRLTKVGTLAVDVSTSGPLIDGTVNGQPMRVSVDVGTTATHIDRATAERAKLTLQHTQFVLYGTAGETRAYRALADEISFGPLLRWQRAGIGVAWDDQGPSNRQAVLAADYLLQTDLEMVLAERQLRFFRPDGCGDAFLAYWDAQAVELPMIERSPQDRRAVVEVLLNGKPVRAIFSSSAPVSVIDQAAAVRAGLQVPEGSARMWPGRFDSIELGAESIRNAQVLVSDRWAPYRRKHSSWDDAERVAGQPEMILGLDFLKAHRVLFSSSQGRVYLSHLGGPVFSLGDPP